MAAGYVGSLADLMQEGMLSIFILSLPIWFTVSGIKLLLKKTDWGTLSYDGLFILVAFTLLAINGSAIVSGVYQIALELMGSTASLAFLGESQIQNYASNYHNPQIVDLMYTVESAIGNVFDLAVQMMTIPAFLGGDFYGKEMKVEIPNLAGITMGVFLIIPYFIVLVVFFAKVVMAVFRVMMLALFSPLAMYCFAFGWGRGMGVKAVKTAFAAIMILLACTAAMSMLVYGAAQVETARIAAENFTEFEKVWRDYLLLIALGWLGTAFMAEANGLANSLADSALSNAGAAIITAGAGATAMGGISFMKNTGLRPKAAAQEFAGQYSGLTSNISKAAGTMMNPKAALVSVAAKLAKLKSQT